MTGWFSSGGRLEQRGRKLGAAGLCLALLTSQPLASAETLPKQSQERLQGVVRILGKAASGKKLLEQAQAFWNLKDAREVVRFLRWDSASRTDAVLIRHFDPRTGIEDRERKVTVYLRSNQKLEEVVMDLAHELSHAVAKPVWDPYDPELSAGDYLSLRSKARAARSKRSHASARSHTSWPPTGNLMSLAASATLIPPLPSR